MGPTFPQRLERFLPWTLLLLGLVDRAIVIQCYGTSFLSTDDTIIWAAAVDYGQGLFRGPYYYGQNYGPMLEALIAAPFTRTGIPLWWIMPIVTTVLGMLPYWSFTLWHIKHRRTAAAVCFAALPLLLPVEFSLMTTMSRGFITGLAPLALLPWILDLRNGSLRSMLTGTIISVAWYINPNSVIFTVGYLCWYILTQRSWAKQALIAMIGLAPGAVAHLVSQSWCEAHVDRIIHRLRPEQLSFEPSLMFEGLSRLDAHFQWLMPLVWPIGSLVGVVLLALLVLALWNRKWPVVMGLTAPVAISILALGIEKTHEGWDSVFFPLSRMFLALPLLMTWAITLFIGSKRLSVRLMIPLALLPPVTIAWKATIIERTTLAHVNERSQWVEVSPVAQMREDAERIHKIAERHRIGLIVPLSATIWPQFRAFLYPVLEPDLAPTYMLGYERRYWQRDRYAKAVVKDLLFVGGMPERWRSIRSFDPRFLRVEDPGVDEVHVLTGNTQPTDSIAQWVKGQLGMY